MAHDALRCNAVFSYDLCRQRFHKLNDLRKSSSLFSAELPSTESWFMSSFTESKKGNNPFLSVQLSTPIQVNGLSGNFSRQIRCKKADQVPHVFRRLGPS